jgi:hypothetical protein
MAVTVEMLQAKLADLQRGLAEVSAALDELAAPPASNPPTANMSKPEEDPMAGIAFTDPRILLPVLDEALTKMGIDVTAPAMKPEEVQELMLREGVRPEDNLISRGIIEAREEQLL